MNVCVFVCVCAHAYTCTCMCVLQLHESGIESCYYQQNALYPSNTFLEVGILGYKALEFWRLMALAIHEPRAHK